MTHEEFRELKLGNLVKCSWGRYWLVLSMTLAHHREFLEVTEAKQTLHGEWHEQGGWVSGWHQLKRIA